MEAMLHLFLLLAAVHFIGDFAFQSAWMAMEKGKNWEVLIYHCLTYTAPFVVLLHFLGSTHMLLATLILFTSHILIDTMSARLKWIKTIWLDQLCHVSVLVILQFAGWL